MLDAQRIELGGKVARRSNLMPAQLGVGMEVAALLYYIRLDARCAGFQLCRHWLSRHCASASRGRFNLQFTRIQTSRRPTAARRSHAGKIAFVPTSHISRLSPVRPGTFP